MILDISPIGNHTSLIHRTSIETELTMVLSYVIEEANIVESQSCWNSYYERFEFSMVDDGC